MLNIYSRFPTLPTSSDRKTFVPDFSLLASMPPVSDGELKIIFLRRPLQT
jgi:hypothetical protein